MDNSEIIAALASLAQTTRLRHVSAVGQQRTGRHSRGRACPPIDVPQNTMSAHLAFSPAQVWSSGSGTAARSFTSPISSDSATSRCSFSRIAAAAVLTYARRSSPISPLAARQRFAPMIDRVFNVLFLCTGNRPVRSSPKASCARTARGASMPFRREATRRAGQSLRTQNTRSLGYPTEGMRSKSWEEFAASDAPKMDFVFTVCDNAAGEACPVWPGQPMTAHWGIEDPAAVEGTNIDKERAFNQAFRLPAKPHRRLRRCRSRVSTTCRSRRGCRKSARWKARHTLPKKPDAVRRPFPIIERSPK